MSGTNWPLGSGAQPAWIPGYVPPAGEWNMWWSNKIDVDNPIFETGPWLPLAGGTLTGLLRLAGPPVNPLDAATKAYVDAITPASGPFLPLTGGVMTGTLTLHADPANNLDAVTKQYSDANRTLANQALTTAQAAVPKAGGTMTGALFLSADPTSPLGAATKAYADKMLPLAGGTVTGNTIFSSTLQVNGNAYVTPTLYVNSYNNWEWWFSTDTSGNKIVSYRSSWFDMWRSSDGMRIWAGAAGNIMTLDGTGSLWLANQLTTVNNVVAGGSAISNGGRLIAQHAGGNPSVCVDDNTQGVAAGMFLGSGGALDFGSMDANGNYAGALFASMTAAGTTVTGGLTATGSVTANGALYAGGSSQGFALYIDGSANRVIQFNPSPWYLTWNATNGNFSYVRNDYVNLMTSTGAGDFAIAGLNAFKPGGGSWAAPSDARVKMKGANYTQGLSAIIQLQPVWYTYRGNDTVDPPVGTSAPYTNSPHYIPANAGAQFVGFIAQDIEGAMPDMVTQVTGYIDGTEYTDVRIVDRSNLTLAMVNAFVEVNNRLIALEQFAGITPSSRDTQPGMKA